MELISQVQSGLLSRSRASFDSDDAKANEELVSTLPPKNLRVADLVLETLLNGYDDFDFTIFNLFPTNTWILIV